MSDYDDRLLLALASGFRLQVEDDTEQTMALSGRTRVVTSRTAIYLCATLDCSESMLHGYRSCRSAILSNAWALLQSRCKFYPCNGSIRARIRSTPARPYISRLSVFNRLISYGLCQAFWLRFPDRLLVRLCSS